VALALGATVAIVLASAAVSCNAILGMEMLDPMPTAGSGGTSSGTGGDSGGANSGGTNSGGTNSGGAEEGGGGQGGSASKKNKGQDCTDGTECKSGQCVDDVCCDASSCPECEACNIADMNGEAGSCLPQPVGSACGSALQEPTCDPDYCDSDGKCVDATAADGNPCSENGGSMCCSLKCGAECEATRVHVQGGTFKRSYDNVTFTDPSFPATVDDFIFDRYEVTVARFRAFVAAGAGTQAAPPGAGQGAHPKIAGSGWDAMWDGKLEANTSALKAALKCDGAHSTWVEPPGQGESLPINCVTWLEAFAFCAWEGKRLLTEAEWNYAAAGGEQQRAYPWSNPANSTSIDSTYAAYGVGISQVGARSPMGDGRWGGADLAGNMGEWVLDSYVATYSTPCVNCAALGVGIRSLRGGSWDGSPFDLRVGTRYSSSETLRESRTGFRCAHK